MNAANTEDEKIGKTKPKTKAQFCLRYLDEEMHKNDDNPSVYCQLFE